MSWRDGDLTSCRRSTDIPELLEKATRLREEEEERGLEKSLSERTAGGSCRSSGIESGDGGGRGSAGLVRSATAPAVTPGSARRDARLSGMKSSGGRCRSRGSRVGVTVTQSLADVLSFIKPGYRCSGASSSSTASSDSDSQTKRDSLDSGLSDMAEQGSEGLTLGSRGAKDAAWERPGQPPGGAQGAETRRPRRRRTDRFTRHLAPAPQRRAAWRRTAAAGRSAPPRTPRPRAGPPPPWAGGRSLTPPRGSPSTQPGVTAARSSWG
ncbi:uncharacterized protein LOC133353450 [Lethenteron reissneri]|uniref:uncharacterized protein LOC133353450 n=1 Tax=Lethenteron reissneri TaxID=7753 RepID=UPI002AB6F288|nr:uncharacterized protein LOC133353450 [Lethenteron reissneri]